MVEEEKRPQSTLKKSAQSSRTGQSRQSGNKTARGMAEPQPDRRFRAGSPGREMAEPQPSRRFPAGSPARGMAEPQPDRRFRADSPGGAEGSVRV